MDFLQISPSDAVLVGLRQALNMSENEREMLVSQARKTVVDNFRVQSSVAKGLDYMQIEPASVIAR